MRISKILIAFIIGTACIAAYFFGKVIFIKILAPQLIFPVIKNDYPDSWNSLKIGEKRSEVHKKLGYTPYNLWEWKGDVWVKDNSFGQYDCRVFYDLDTTVEYYAIEAFFGDKETYSKQLIKSEP